jgi:hypothetical protein
MPPRVTSLDHAISLQNGSTSALEYTTQRMQSAKSEPIPNMLTRVEGLTREVGCLRQEISYYRDCFENFHGLRETSYDVYQQLYLEAYLPTSVNRLQELTAQLHRGLEDSVQREVEAEKEWKEFWGVTTDKEASKGELI